MLNEQIDGDVIFASARDDHVSPLLRGLAELFKGGFHLNYFFFILNFLNTNNLTFLVYCWSTRERGRLCWPTSLRTINQSSKNILLKE